MGGYISAMYIAYRGYSKSSRKLLSLSVSDDTKMLFRKSFLVCFITSTATQRASRRLLREHFVVGTVRGGGDGRWTTT